MTWLALAAACAVVYAFHGAWSKRVATGVGPLVAAWALFAFSLPFLLAYLVLTGIPEIGPRFWWALGANAFLNLGAATLFLAALRAGDLGITYPLLALTPLFVIPVERVLLGVLPGGWGVAGILLMVGGIYLLHFGDRRAGILGPLGALVRSPGARLALATAVIWSVSGTVDRVGVLESSPAFYGSLLAGSLALLFPPLILIRRRWKGQNPGGAPGATSAGDLAPEDPPDRGGPLPEPRKRRGLVPLFLIHGLLFAVMYILQMEALRLALASYVLSVKRTGAILAVILGWAAFKEASLRHRLVGTVLTVAGAGVLALWG